MNLLQHISWGRAFTHWETINGCKLTTKSARRPPKGTTLSRAGMAVDSKIEHLLTEVEPINQRIIKAIFSCNPDIFPLDVVVQK